MNPKKVAILNIAVAIFFAAAIIFSDFLLAGTEYNEIARNALIALWFIPFSYLSSCTGCRSKQC